MFTASSGEDALRNLDETHPDVVTLSLALPGINGFWTLHLLKKVAPQAHVVMISACSGPEAVAEAMRLGATDYLGKPFEPESLGRVVLSLLAADSPPPPRGASTGPARVKGWREWDSSLPEGARPHIGRCPICGYIVLGGLSGPDDPLQRSR